MGRSGIMCDQTDFFRRINTNTDTDVYKMFLCHDSDLYRSLDMITWQIGQQSDISSLIYLRPFKVPIVKITSKARCNGRWDYISLMLYYAYSIIYNLILIRLNYPRAGFKLIWFWVVFYCMFFVTIIFIASRIKVPEGNKSTNCGKFNCSNITWPISINVL